jgi:hypothetical protein
VLHLESFIEDLGAAWVEFVRRVEEDAQFRERVLARTRQAPLMALLGDDTGSASVAHTRTTVVGTYFSSDAAQAASGAPGRGWPRTSPPPYQVERPSSPPQMDIPKGGKRKRKKN